MATKDRYLLSDHHSPVHFSQVAHEHEKKCQIFLFIYEIHKQGYKRDGDFADFFLAANAGL